MNQLCNASVIKDLLKQHNFRFSKTLGQNFLINPTVCPKIAEDGIRVPHMGVIEIGTGFGVLTNELAKRAKKVIAIEIDERLLPVLNETLQEYDNIKVINQDVMNLDLNQLISEEFPNMDVCICANLPYYITSPVLMKLLEDRLKVVSITVMVQKEAAVRLCAEPGSRECGAVTFAVRYYSKPKQLFTVSRGSFMPSPNVDSAVVRFERIEPEHGAHNEAFLFSTVRAAFSQRRKTLVNPVSSMLGIPKKNVISALEACSLKISARAEEMKFDEWIRFANELETRR